jgi:hypothetical protein
MASKVLAIAGMHRSGTSLVAQYLGECGLHVGDNLTTSQLNQTRNFYGGHHEDQEFSNFHKGVLKKKFISDFPTWSLRIPVRVGKQDRELATALVQVRQTLPQWGWKDPRTTLFLDFWGEVIGDLQYLLLIRHPLAVVDSLLRRNHEKQISRNPINGLRVWSVYNQQVLRFYTNHPSVSIVYDIDELVHDPDRLRRMVVDKFGFDLNPIDFGKVFSQKAFRIETSEQVEQMKSKYPNEVSKALDLYQQLQSIARN